MKTIMMSSLMLLSLSSFAQSSLRTLDPSTTFLNGTASCLDGVLSESVGGCRVEIYSGGNIVGQFIIEDDAARQVESQMAFSAFNAMVAEAQSNNKLLEIELPSHDAKVPNDPSKDDISEISWISSKVKAIDKPDIVKLQNDLVLCQQAQLASVTGGTGSAVSASADSVTAVLTPASSAKIVPSSSEVLDH